VVKEKPGNLRKLRKAEDIARKEYKIKINIIILSYFIWTIGITLPMNREMPHVF
jgi:hypothetical protein